MEFYGFAVDYGEEMTNSFLNDENSLPDTFIFIRSDERKWNESHRFQFIDANSHLRTHLKDRNRN